ncbi:MAG: c-type cytochrome [Betaproteobacteria bacterium]|nr:c-type cytochrome [Betaproteobacteria bacterium]
MKGSMAMLAVAGIFAATHAYADTVGAADLAAAQQIVTSTCSACHGADGNSVVPMYPRLAGQQAAYITKQLEDFKSGKRQNAIMQGMAATLTPQQMVALGVFFSEQKPQIEGATNAKLAAAGEKIYKGGIAATNVPACMACHGPTGAGIPTEFPRLGGQHAQYVTTQLDNFRSDTRTNDPAKMMRMIASRLTDQDIAALAQYIAGLH